MQPAKRMNSSPLGLCGAPAEKVPAPPLPNEDPDKASLLKAFEAVVAAGRRGLLGPTAKAAVEALPDVDLEGSDGKAGQETPSPVPLVEEKGEDEEKKEEEEDKEKEEEKEEEGKKKGKRKRKKGKGCNTVVSITPPVAGTGSSKPCKKEIWITGDSVISLSMKRAQFSYLGKRLRLPSDVSVIWRGIPMMVWDDLLPILHCIYHQRPFPAIIIIHLGGTDLWRDSSISLVTKMQNDLGVLQKAFPDVVIIWSSLLPKPVCKTSEELQDLESKRSNVNSEMEEYCNENGICYLSHPLFTVENKALFLPHDILNTLSNEGADIFITDLKEILHTYLIHKKC